MGVNSDLDLESIIGRPEGYSSKILMIFNSSRREHVPNMKVALEVGVSFMQTDNDAIGNMQQYYPSRGKTINHYKDGYIIHRFDETSDLREDGVSIWGVID